MHVPLGVSITTLLSSGLQCFRAELGSQTSQRCLARPAVRTVRIKQRVQKIIGTALWVLGG